MTFQYFNIKTNKLINFETPFLNGPKKRGAYTMLKPVVGIPVNILTESAGEATAMKPPLPVIPTPGSVS